MAYSIFSILAALFLLLSGRDALWNAGTRRASRAFASYRRFLFGTLLFLGSDIAWGFLDELHLATALYIDTSAYFLALAATAALWMDYAAAYLEADRRLAGTLLRVPGWGFLACAAAAWPSTASIPSSSGTTRPQPTMQARFAERR